MNPGVSAAALLHSKSLRGHRDCFEKCHVIANQKLSCSRGGRSTYQGLKLAVSQRLSRIIQYTQNSVSLGGPGRPAANQNGSSQQGNKQPPQAGSQVPRYTRCWELGRTAAPPAYTVGVLEGHTPEELGLLQLEPPSGAWPSGGVGGAQRRKQPTPGSKPDHRAWPNPSREERKLQEARGPQAATRTSVAQEVPGPGGAAVDLRDLWWLIEACLVFSVCHEPGGGAPV